MENTPYQRLELFWLSKGLKNMSAFAEEVGLKPATVSAIKQRGSQPSNNVMRTIQYVYPDLNPEYVLWGTGPMLRDGRALAPAPALAPVADYTSGPGTIDATVNLLLREQLSEAREQARADRALIAWLQAELGKSPDSSDAAGHYHFPALPLPVQDRIGFKLSIQARVGRGGVLNR